MSGYDRCVCGATGQIEGFEENEDSKRDVKDKMITALRKLWKITEYRALSWSALGLECVWP